MRMTTQELGSAHLDENHVGRVGIVSLFGDSVYPDALDAKGRVGDDLGLDRRSKCAANTLSSSGLSTFASRTSIAMTMTPNVCLIAARGRARRRRFEARPHERARHEAGTPRARAKDAPMVTGRWQDGEPMATEQHCV